MLSCRDAGLSFSLHSLLPRSVRGGSCQDRSGGVHGVSRDLQAAQAQLGVIDIADDHEFIGLGLVGQLLQPLAHGIGAADDAHCQEIGNRRLGAPIQLLPEVRYRGR